MIIWSVGPLQYNTFRATNPEKSLDSPPASARIPPNPVIVKEILKWDEITSSRI